MTQAYPLQWPSHVPRTKRREDGPFQTGISNAINHLRQQISLIPARNVVISTNMAMRLDGSGPLAKQRTPDDPGVAVYFERRGKTVCIACDRYSKVRSNVRAIGLTIEAMRGIKRWGSSEMDDQIFGGFTALPPPDQMSPIVTPAPSNWWDVLGVSQNAPWSVIQGAHRALVMEAGGGTVELNAAFEAARKEKGQ